MSAFQVSANHLAVLVDAKLAIANENHGDPIVYRDRLLRMLSEENALSVNHRYGRDDKRSPPVTEFPEFNRNVIRDHGVLKILKAVSCFEYQACEAAAWDDSDARKFCMELRLALIERIPGYEQAEGWGIE